MGGEADSARGPRSIRVLIVEDDPDLGQTMSDVLADEGHQVAIAQSLSEAIVAIEQAPFEVLVADHRLRGEISDRLFEVLSEAPVAPSTILCSATPSLVEIAKSYGLYFLAKPFDLDAFVALVANAAEHPRRPSRSRPA